MAIQPYGSWSSWDPFRELDQVRTQVAALLAGHPAAEFGSEPAVQVWAREDGAVLTADLPGIDPEHLEISVEQDVVTLSGARADEPLGDDAQVLRRERGTGAFRRHVRLPFRVDAESADARFRNGVLELTLPKSPDDRPRRIPVGSH